MTGVLSVAKEKRKRVVYIVYRLFMEVNGEKIA